MTPIETVWDFMINELGSWINWLEAWSLFGVPILFYFMGFVILGLLIDFIFG